MKITTLSVPGVLLLEPEVFADARGFFFESFNRRQFLDDTGIDADFVQDNHSRSVKDVLRGLHYQLPPRAQGKLVRVSAGEIFDVSVDIRPGSASYGHWVGQILSAENQLQLWIPPGFAHGFLVLSEFADVLYKTTDYRVPELERSICWNDRTLAIDWPLRETPVLSEKDRMATPFLATGRWEQDQEFAT